MARVSQGASNSARASKPSTALLMGSSPTGIFILQGTVALAEVRTAQLNIRAEGVFSSKTGKRSLLNLQELVAFVINADVLPPGAR